MHALCSSELNNNRFEVSHVHKVECVVPWLNDTLVFFTISLQLCQQLKDKVSSTCITHTAGRCQQLRDTVMLQMLGTRLDTFCNQTSLLGLL